MSDSDGDTNMSDSKGKGGVPMDKALVEATIEKR